MNKTIHIGEDDSGRKILIDLPALIDTRLQVTSNSGGGKSWLLRRLIEQIDNAIQVVVLDWEGEFVTLRERLDMVLVGNAGEIAAEPSTARLLARRIMEEQVSAVVDLSDLALAGRRSYIREYLESLIALPNKLWRPLIVVIDEAHLACPESGDVESSAAVIALMSQGRKRGYCGCLATQRLAKLHKDASAEVNNHFIGRMAQDVDQNRACDILGIPRSERNKLRDLSPRHRRGEFYAFGPALSFDGIERMRVGDVATTHPKAGSRHKFIAPKPSTAILKIAEQFKDLPQQADAEAKDLAEARSMIADLKSKLAQRPEPKPAETKIERREIPVLSKSDRKLIEREITIVDKLYDRLGDVVKLSESCNPAEIGSSLRDALNRLSSIEHAAGNGDAKSGGGGLQSAEPLPAVALPARVERGPADPNLGKGGMRKMMIALAQNPNGLTDSGLGARTNLPHSGKTYATYLSRMRKSGWVESSGGVHRITDAGLKALGTFVPLPSGKALIDHWLGKLGGGMKSIFEYVAARPNAPISAAEVASAVGIDSQKTFDTYLSRLRKLDLVVGSDQIQLAKDYRL